MLMCLNVPANRAALVWLHSQELLIDCLIDTHIIHLLAIRCPSTISFGRGLYVQINGGYLNYTLSVRFKTYNRIVRGLIILCTHGREQTIFNIPSVSELLGVYEVHISTPTTYHRGFFSR